MESQIKRLLRSPKLILGEIAALALVGALGAAREEWHVFRSPAFVALAALTAVSLAIVVVDQFRRLRAGWNLRLTLAHFQSAPFKTEFERPATASRPSVKIWTERRLGLAGSFVFHSGLLLIMLAGMLRALFATDAATDLLETETLAPQTAAWAGQFPGVAAKPFSLDREITLRDVKATRFADGDLRSLNLTLVVDGREREVGINQELRLAGGRIYPGHNFGTAALIESQQGNDNQRRRVFLADVGHGDYAAEFPLAAGLRAHLRSHIGNDGHRAGAVELRVMRGNALVAAETLPVGATLALPDGGKIILHGLPMWARLNGSRDAALPLAYAGMILAMFGAAMIFCLVKLDCCVIVTPIGDREKVFVALKPHRFAPLFREKFDALLSAQREFGVRRQSEAATALSDEKRGRAALAPAVQNVLARTACWLLLGAGLLFVTGCDRVSSAQARALVERYNQVVSEAYRRGDVRLVDPVVGDKEGKKLTGLIGVRLDLGITLDSKLLALDIAGVEQGKNELRVRTKERWSYRDLKIGSGEQVGEASQDSYEMLYVFTNINKIWLVDEIKFAAPPQVGRKETPWVAERSVLHGTQTPPTTKETNQP